LTERFDIRARARSFVFAGRGLVALAHHEHNLRIHLVVAAIIVAMAAWLGVSPVEWAVLALAIGSVLGAEALNSSIEALADALHPDRDPKIAYVKDVAAAGVLIVAAAAAVVGLLILGPPLWRAIGPWLGRG